MYAAHPEFAAELLNGKLGITHIVFYNLDRLFNQLLIQRSNLNIRRFDVDMFDKVFLKRYPLSNKVFDSRLQDLEIERFGHIIAGAALETLDLLLFSSARGQQDYRNV